ncbi:MAG: response regulator, partial [Prolixibacteraceae bacterium]|nr:response regulator [Prolixibacteraceae bacterium]
FNYIAKQKKINYKFSSNVDSFFMAFDSDKLDKVISNLLSNAFKNTDENESIELIVDIDNTKSNKLDKFIILKVVDSGNGISEKDLPHIFDRFYMVSNPNTSSQGTGIGLTLSKELVELHNGTIQVNSVLGKGSEFIVQIPLKIEEEPSIKSQINENNDEFDDPSRDNTLNKETSKVLIVEDDVTLLEFLKHELQNTYKVFTSKNGKEGFDIAMAESPNLIISDIMMPVMDGIEFCKKIKEESRTSHIPIILLTARHSQEKVLEGIQSGADAYVQKPFNLQLLLSRISNLLNLSKHHFEKFENGTSLLFENEAIESRDQKLIQDIINIILENITNEKINAKFIADNLHMSRSLVYIKIEAISGKTVNEFIRNIRLKKSIEYLKTNELTITEIAYSIGFSSQSYYTRSFVKQYGCSPKKYQQNNL